ncbi:hypothetical protein [Photobacterium alginatilyticum]|nr:hypothetical protein [Photobacterium alginatilyticum]
MMEHEHNAALAPSVVAETARGQGDAKSLICHLTVLSINAA